MLRTFQYFKGTGVALVLFMVVINHSILAALDFGEACVEGERDECDRWKALACRDSKCQCIVDTNMIYSDGECRVFTNANNCTIQIDDSTWRDLSCLDRHAQCSLMDDICVCVDGYLPSEQNGTGINVRCLPRDMAILKHAGVHCNYSNYLVCPIQTGLECIEGECQCPHPRTQHLGWIDDYQRKCVTGPLIPNACNPDSESSDQNCDFRAVCRADKMCHCSEGYSASYSIPPRCLPSFEQTCESHLEAQRHKCNTDAGLTCAEGKCMCPPDTFFNGTAKACYVFEGEPCIPEDLEESGTIRCAPNLECILVDPEINPYIGVCTNFRIQNKFKTNHN